MREADSCCDDEPMQLSTQENDVSIVNAILGKMRKKGLAMFGLVFLCILILAAVFAPQITNHERDHIDMVKVLQPPSRSNWLGTDDLGRDVYTRLIYGTRVSISVGIVSTSIAVLIGVFLGAMSGYFGGAVDALVMRAVDVFMCFPFYLIAIVMASILGPSLFNLMLIAGILNWPKITRIVRAEVLSLKHREFIEASRALGLSSGKIILKHIIPNTLAPVIVYATLGIAQGILMEAGMSYLGLGVKQPVPSWGNMLASAQDFGILVSSSWLWIPPGVMVFLSVLSINFLGDGLRDALDPKIVD
ncbi:MAG: oligopeptide ABC transporter permease [Spirochaetota bacterium]